MGTIFNSNTWEYTMVNKRIYGLPFERIYEGLFVNKKMFSKYNVKVPETFEELLTAVKVFSSNKIPSISYNSTAEGSYLYQAIVAGLGGKKNVEEPFADKTDKNCYVEGMRVMKQLYDMGAFPADCFLMSSVDRDERFLDGKIPMIVQGTWFNGKFDSKDKWVDFVPFPR